MAKTLKATPILYATLGAAVSYYGIGPIRGHGWVLWFLGFMLILLMSLMQALVQTPARFFEDPRVRCSVRRGKVYLIALSLGFSLGLKAGVSPPVRLGLPEAQIIGIYGTLQDDPRLLTQGRGMANLTLQRVSGIGGIQASAQGKIGVLFPDETIPRLKTFGRGSEVYLEGRLLSPKTAAGNSRGTDPLFLAQSVHIVQFPPLLERVRSAVRREVIQRFVGPSWGGLALALLLGVKDNLDTELSKSYQYAGCSHVLALSGMHLAIIATVFTVLLKKPLGLKAAAIISMLGILSYVYLVGNLSSLHRAAIMYILGTLALLGALPRQPATLLGMTFLIQISLQPESGHGIAFILSYLALGGILFIGETIYELIRGILPEIAAQPLAASLGAFIATSAVMTLFFGMLRPIGILAGLIIVPLTTLFMLGAMTVLVLPFLVKPLGMILSLWYAILEKLASLAALTPGIPISSPVPVLLVSLGLWVLCIGLRSRQNAQRRNLAPFHCS
jgi:competence protein ComEC